MGTRTVQSVSKAETEQIIRIFRKNGTTPTVIANVGHQYRLAESAAAAFAQAINESDAKAKGSGISEAAAHGAFAGMEAALSTRQGRILYESAREVLDGATRAETDLSTASISDLEAYATMGIARQAWSS
jgi:hypothetical protein